MPPTNTLLGAKSSKRRRAYSKRSRGGCVNCKLRRVKCDQIKPTCEQCRSFHVRCFYDSKASSDSLRDHNSSLIDMGVSGLYFPIAYPPVCGTPGSPDAYTLHSEDLPLIDWFCRHTSSTLGSQATASVYAEKGLQLAFSSPMTMHAILAVAHCHMSTSTNSAVSSMASIIRRHHIPVLSMLRQRLSRPILASEREATWLTSYLLSVTVYACPATTSVTEAWPLRSHVDDADFAWLHFCLGSRIVAKVTDPGRPESEMAAAAQEIFAAVRTAESLTTAVESGEQDLKGLPSGLCDLFELCYRDRRQSPYYGAAIGIANILSTDMDIHNCWAHLSFLSLLDEGFWKILKRKDERAMLVLLLWYAKICDLRLWWMWRQAWTEGLAIYTFLNNRWAGRPNRLCHLEEPYGRLITAACSPEVVMPTA